MFFGRNCTVQMRSAVTDQRKFVSYIALAFWITITAILIGTTNEWGRSEAQLAANIQEGTAIDQTLAAMNASPEDETKEFGKKWRESDTNTKSFFEDYSRSRSLRRQLRFESAFWLMATLVVSFLWARPPSPV